MTKKDKPDHERILDALLRGRWLAAYEIGDAVGGQDDSVHRAMYTLRNAAPYALLYRIDSRWREPVGDRARVKEYIAAAVAPQDWQQESKPCACGSWYSKKHVCNVCKKIVK